MPVDSALLACSTPDSLLNRRTVVLFKNHAAPSNQEQVDGALLAHPGVAEAVSFAAPDEKYGEASCLCMLKRYACC